MAVVEPLSVALTGDVEGAWESTTAKPWAVKGQPGVSDVPHDASKEQLVECKKAAYMHTGGRGEHGRSGDRV